jgi:hypothetical protein
MSAIALAIVIGVCTSLLTAAIVWFFTWIIRKGLADLRKQVTPNGGGSLFDFAKEAKILSQRAVDVSLATDAKVKKLEDKLDAFFLSRIP